MRMTLAQWRQQIFRMVPRVREQRPKREPARLHLFRCEALHENVSAHTKGEARAKLKQKLGLPRLPAGTVLTRVS